jgi:thiol-disulfide isomerase/thioredoxin
MKRIAFVGLIALLTAGTIQGQRVREINADALLSRLQHRGDSIVVVNFWATWCSPCVKELPHFDSLYRNSTDPSLNMMLVSLDFPRQLDSRLLPFLDEQDISAPVYLMTDLDYNSWIERIDPAWSGAIPATLLLQGERRIFLEKELKKEELDMHMEQLLREP